jgi:hypothetical protein
MIKHMILVLFVNALVALCLCSQGLWNLTPSENIYRLLPRDTETEELKRIITESDRIYHVYAATLILIDRGGEAVKDFILNTLRKNYTPDEFDYREWGNYYSYQKYLYHYGEGNPVQGMRNLAEHTEAPLSYRCLAIGALAELVYYEHIDVLKEHFDESDVEPVPIVLVRYGKQPQFKEEVGDIFANVVMNSDDRMDFSRAVSNLAEVDKERAISLLEERYFNVGAEIRSSIVTYLRKYDLYNMPERYIQFMPHEDVGNNRTIMVPFYSSILEGNRSIKFLEPDYVSFIANWREQESHEVVLMYIDWFLEEFKPLPPPDDKPLNEAIEDLRGLLFSIAEYDMVGDQLLIQELEGYITEAVGQVNFGNEPEAARQLLAFQTVVSDKRESTIDSEEQGTPLPQRLITSEGYRYLYYAVGYILDRLPDPGKIPDPPGSGIESGNTDR